MFTSLVGSVVSWLFLNAQVKLHNVVVIILLSSSLRIITIDLLIYQTICYTHDDLDMIDVDDYLMKICGQAEFLKK